MLILIICLDIEILQLIQFFSMVLSIFEDCRRDSNSVEVSSVIEYINSKINSNKVILEIKFDFSFNLLF